MTTILQIAESQGTFSKVMHSLENQLVGINEIRIAGRTYKRQSEFFDNQWSTTSNSVEFAANAGIHVDQDDIVRWDSNNQEPFGDMRQELVFIGQNLDQELMTEALDACLLTEDELLNGRQFWETLPDPFPVWEEAA